MKIVAFVPIKLQSQRLPGKMLLSLHGKPLCRYIFETLSQTGIDVYAYCSDVSLKSLLPDSVQFIQRSQHLDDDSTLGLEIYKAFSEAIPSDYYLLCHATSPFTKASTLSHMISSISDGYDSALTVKRHQTFAWYKNKPLNYETNNVIRTQDIEPVFIETSGGYLYHANHLKNNARIGTNPKLVEVDSKESVDIDTLDDFKLAESMYENNSI